MDIMTKLTSAAIGLWILYVLGLFTFWGFVAYAIVHFVLKNW
jgi:hypothetical protein